MTSRTDHSLSFLDLITCALGGVLLLSFVVLTIYQIGITGGERASEPLDLQNVAPFVVVAYPPEGGAWDLTNSGDASPWKLTPADEAYVARCDRRVSNQFALLIADSPPPLGTSIDMTGAGIGRVEVQVFYRGHRVWAGVPQQQDSGWRVWPAPTAPDATGGD